MRNLIVKGVALLFLASAPSLFATSSSDSSYSGSASVYLDKWSYSAYEPIKVKVNGMIGGEEDWVGIYPTGSSNKWKNVVSWKWTYGIKSGTVTLDGVPAGSYEARIFFNNSFRDEDSVQFVVESDNQQAEEDDNNNNQNPVDDNNNQVNQNISVSSGKSVYRVYEPIKVRVSGIDKALGTWVGVYPSGASNDWDNVLVWQWPDAGIRNGTITLDGVSAGSYEARVFINDSFQKRASVKFKVKGQEQQDQEDNNQGDHDNENDGDNQNQQDEVDNDNQQDQNAVFVEDAENGLSPNWITVLGNFKPILQNPGYHSSHCVKLTTNWVSNVYNKAEYWLLTDNKKYKYLDIDIGGVGRVGGHVGGIHRNSPAGHMPHYFVGVRVNTKHGERSMIWDSWYNHEGMPASLNDYGDGNIELVFPSPIELVRGYGFTPVNNWAHFKVDLEKALKLLEPNNSIKSVKAFTASGGFLDNIKLSN